MFLLLAHIAFFNLLGEDRSAQQAPPQRAGTLERNASVSTKTKNPSQESVNVKNQGTAMAEATDPCAPTQGTVGATVTRDKIKQTV